MAPRVLEDSDWAKRSKAISFRRMIHVEPSSNERNTFYSTSAGYPPTFTDRTYGGHVFAQAAWAAAHTLPHGLHVHSMTGYFLLLGDTKYPFRYVVRKTRDGGIYALRTVEVFQDSDAAEHGKVPCFIAIVSFKRDERNKHKPGAKEQRRDYEHQELPRDWLETEYGHALRRKSRFEDWPTAQGMDGMWQKGAGLDIDGWKKRGDAFPGLEMKKIDMSSHNGKMSLGGFADGGARARHWKALMLYRIVTDQESPDQRRQELTQTRRKHAADDDINLYACAHLYASDRNSLFGGIRALGFEQIPSNCGSLSHTVNFHGHAEELIMVDAEGNRRKEYIQEAWISNSGADRVCHQSRIWDRETGRIVASTVQDGMMRVPVVPPWELVDGDSILRREAKL